MSDPMGGVKPVRPPWPVRPLAPSHKDREPGQRKKAPQPPQAYVPVSLLKFSSPVKGASVPFCRRILYCPAVKSFFHCASVFTTLSLFGPGRCCP